MLDSALHRKGWLNEATVTLHVLSVQHDQHGLAEVERVHDALPDLVAALRGIPSVRGVVPLGTCNRVELYCDAPNAATSELLDAAACVLSPAPAWRSLDGDGAMLHVFRVAAGLESMVLGEREIAGQVRRALSESQDLGLCSSLLTTVCEAALRTSRRVARETTLAHAGRSVVSEGLDLMEPVEWSNTRVLLVGTGAFAGASVASLRARGAQHISVHSASGRGEEFANSHNLGCVADLPTGLASADLVVTCRGTGTPAVSLDHLPPAGMVPRFLDLSLHRDVDPAVVESGAHVVDLQTISERVAPRWDQDTAHAERVVAEGCAELRSKLDARVLDPAVVNLREAVLELVADEVARLPQGRALTQDDAAHALRRLATRLLHVPSMRAKQAAASGRTQEYLSAMAELYGIGPAGDALDDHSCPATGYTVSDLDARATTEEAS